MRCHHDIICVDDRNANYENGIWRENQGQKCVAEWGGKVSGRDFVGALRWSLRSLQAKQER
jgi:hypothetical protein